MRSKRIFKAIIALALTLAMCVPSISLLAITVTPDISYKFYMVGNSHIDTAWRWPIQHTAEVVISDTFNRQVNALKSDSSYRFTSSCATHYIWTKEYYPDMYEDIKELIADGQWGLAGGQMVEPDLNLMGGEGFVRQGLYAQHFFLEEFDKIATVALVPDVFGFSGQFPQFIRKTGMTSYVATKMNWSSDPADGALDPGPWSQSSNGQNSKGRESDIFWWEALDGTDVLSYNCYNDYTSSYSTSDFRNSSNQVFNRISRSGSFTNSGQPAYNGTYYYDYDSDLKYALGMFGAGDHGGGPSIGTSLGTHGGPAAYSGNETTTGQPTVLPATLEEYFEGVRSDTANRTEGVGLSKVYRHVGENYLSYHRGTYTSWSRVKKDNRQLEIKAVTAETAATLGFWTKSLENNGNEKIAIGWDRILVNHMHDILPGSSSPAEYYQVFMNNEMSRNLFTNVENNALLALAYRADTTVDSGVPVFVYNPLNWQRDGETTTNVTLDKQYDNIKVFDGDTELPTTVIANNDDGTAKISFIAKAVPSLGYKVFKVVGSDDPSALATDVKVVSEDESSIVVENDKLRFTISKATGNMPSLINKTDDDREVFYQTSNLEGNELQFKTDTGGSSYPAWDMTNSEFGGVSQVFNRVNTAAEVPQVVVNTPEKVTIKVVHKITDSANTTPSVATRYITLLAGSDRIDVRFELDWQMYQRNLKLAFPLDVDARGASYEIAYGAMDGATEVKRMDAVVPETSADNPLMSNSITGTQDYAGALGRSTVRDTRWNSARFEHSGHKWMDVTADAGSHGMSILNDAKYGYDVLRMVKSGSTATGMGTDADIADGETYVRTRLTVVRSPISATQAYETSRYLPSNQTIDIGYQDFNYSIYPHSGTWQEADTSRQAHEVNYPMTAFQTVAGAGDGILGKEKSFMAIDKNNVTIGAVKNLHDDQEDRDSMIVRVWETNGADTENVVLTLPSNVLSAKEVNMLEHDYDELSNDNIDAPVSKTLVAKPIAIDGNKVSFDIGKYEVLTLQLKLASYGGEQIELKQKTVSLDSFFNIRGTSPDSDRKAGNLDDLGNTIPEPLWAEARTNRVDYQGIKFDLGPDAASNFVSANGQAIPVNSDGYNRVYLLGVGAGFGSRTGEFTVNYTDGETAEKEIDFAFWRSPLTGWVPADKADTNPYVYDSIAQVFTHWHDGTIDQMTLDNYLFVYYIDIDATKTISSITLPEASGIRLAAITVINSPIPEFASTTENYRPVEEELYWNFSDLTVGSAIGTNLEKEGIAGAEEPVGHRAFVSATAGVSGNSGEGYANILVNDGNTKFCGSVSSSTAWFILDAGEQLKMPAYVIRGANDDMSYTSRVLHTWTVEGSNDSSTWTTISAPGAQGSGWAVNFQTRMFLFDSDAIPDEGFRYYKLTVTRMGTSSSGSAVSGTMQFSYFGLASDYAENGALTAKVENGVIKDGDTITIATVNGSNVLNFNGNVATKSLTPGAAKDYHTVNKGLNIRVYSDTKIGYTFNPKNNASAHMAIDLKFVDGSRLSDLNAVDQYGIGVSPKDQGEGMALQTDQWNYVEIELGKYAKGRVIAEIILGFEIEGADPGEEIEGLFDNVVVFRDGGDFEDVKVFAALYTAEGKLADLSVSESVTMQAFNTLILNPALVLDTSAAGDDYYVKTFIWTSDTYIPLANAVRYEF